MPQIKIPYKPRFPWIHNELQKHRFSVLVAHRRFGKTVLAINHLIRMAFECRRERGKFAYIAPLRNQGKTIAWDYLKYYTSPFPKRIVNESELSIKIPSLYGDLATVRIFGADNPDALRGQYFDCAVLDEVAQMKPDVWIMIVRPCLMDRHGSAVFIGTPKGINTFSEIYFDALKKQAAGDPDWMALCFPADKTDILSKEELEAQKQEDVNIYRQEFLCDFGASSQNSLITLDSVEAALAKAQNISSDMADPWHLILGVDIARFGNDSSVLFYRKGKVALEPLVLKKLRNTEVAHVIVNEIVQKKPTIVNIDQGQGTGVIDMVLEMSHGIAEINEIPFGSHACNPLKFVNRRSEMWTLCRDWLNEGGVLNVGRYAESLKAELTAPSYSFDASSRIQLEKKEEIKTRLKRSTDLADALCLTFAVPIGMKEEKRQNIDRYGRVLPPTPVHTWGLSPDRIRNRDGNQYAKTRYANYLGGGRWSDWM